MNTAAHGSEIFVGFHSVDKGSNRTWPEVNVTVERQDVRIFGDDFFAGLIDRQRQQTITQQVIHVHDLKRELILDGARTDR